MSKLATHPQQKTNALRTAAKNKTRPRLAGLCPIGFRQTPSPGHARAFDIFAACAPGAGCGIQCQWGMGRPAGGCVFVFAAGARRLFFCCGCAASSLTHLLPAVSEHPLQKEIQGPGRVSFWLRVRELTDSRAARRPEHPQQKKHGFRLGSSESKSIKALRNT